VATTSATLSTLTNILKEYYLPPVVDQLNNEILALQILDIDSDHIDLEGLKAVVPLHSARTGGIGSRAELDTLPAAGAQGYKRATYNLKYHYGRIQVSGQSISHTKSGAGAFLQAYKSELDGIKDDLALDFARQVYGNGDGRVAQCGVTSATNVVVLNSSEALDKGFIYVGMRVDVGTTSDPNTLIDGEEVTDVDVANKTFTVSTSITTSTSNWVYRAGNTDPTDATIVKEMDTGLQKLISTSANTVGTLNAASAGLKFWDNQRDTTGGSISLVGNSGPALLYQANRVFSKGVKSDQLKIVSTPGIARRLFETTEFKGSVQFVNSTMLKGGFESISFSAGSGQMNLVTDRLAPYGSMFFVPTKHIKLFSPGDWDFLAKDGQAVKWVQDKDAFQSILFRYANLGTDRRNNSLVISGITDTGF